MAKAKAKASKKEKAPKKVEDTSTPKGLNDELLQVEAELKRIQAEEIRPRRRRIAEIQRKLSSSMVKCSCENFTRVPDSNMAQCQNPECGKVIRLQR